MTPPRPSGQHRRQARAYQPPRSRTDAPEQWIVWRDYDREVEWAGNALLDVEALGRLAPPRRRARR